MVEFARVRMRRCGGMVDGCVACRLSATARLPTLRRKGEDGGEFRADPGERYRVP